MTIFYFTATGNSLYVSKKIGDNLISIPQFIKSNETAYQDDVIGVVYPCYAGGIPRIVKRFLDKVKLSANYKFTIMTYGNESTNALDQMDKYALSKGIEFDYMNRILMANNYLPMFKVEDQLEKIPQKGIEKAIGSIVKDVNDRKQYKPKVGFADKFWGAIFRSGAEKMTGGNADMRFSTNGSCKSCDTCVSVCSVNNICIESNSPVFKHQCEGCLACIHHCPNGAIHMKGEKSATRFCNEHIGIDEIITSNVSAILPQMQTGNGGEC